MKRMLAGRLFVALLTIAGLWILLVGSVSWHEISVGLFGLLLTMTFITVAYVREKKEVRFAWSDLLQVWRTPAEVVSGLVTLLRVLAADLAGHPAREFFCFCGIVTAKDDPQLTGRRILATVYGSIAPDTIVLGIDYAQSRLLLHQLRRAPVGKTLIKLGARQ